MIKITAIQFKRGLRAKLEEILVGANKPLSGEPVYEIDNNKLKIGDGEHDYKDLPYLGGGGGGSQRLVYNSVTELPSVGDPNMIYVIKDGNTYIWSDLHYKTKFVNNEQFYALITDTNGNIIGAERQINAGNAVADYNIENFEI